MNTSRLVASVGGYFLSAGGDTVVQHLYGGVTADLALDAGGPRYAEESAYPWGDAIRIRLEPDRPMRVTLHLPMTPRRTFAHPAVGADAGRVALERGPLVYCAKGPDNPGGPVQDLRLPADATLADV